MGIISMYKNAKAGYDAGKKIVAAAKIKKAKDATEAALKAKQKAEEVIRLAKIAKEAKRVAGLEKKAATLKTLKVAAGTGVAGVAAGAYMQNKYSKSSSDAAKAKAIADKAKAIKQAATKKAMIKILPPMASRVLNLKKTGGVTKATKFAALAPPFNKATAADRIAGAKKNMRKKK
jgi:hypothetical protein